jgi:hypothetical protein
MRYIRTLASISAVAITLAILLFGFNTSESYAQNNTLTESNQSSGTANNTAGLSNQSDSGSISGWGRGTG